MAIGLPYTLNSVFLEFEQWKRPFSIPISSKQRMAASESWPFLARPHGGLWQFCLWCSAPCSISFSSAPFPCFCHILHSPFIFPLAHGIMHSVFLCATQPQHCSNKKISFFLNTRLASHSDLVGLCFEFSCEWQGARSCSYRQGHFHLLQRQWEWVTSSPPATLGHICLYFYWSIHSTPPW